MYLIGARYCGLTPTAADEGGGDDNGELMPTEADKDGGDDNGELTPTEADEEGYDEACLL